MLAVSFMRALKRRWLANGLPDFPLWVSPLIFSSALATSVAAVVERGSDPWLAIGLVLLAMTPWAVELWVREPWLLFAVVTCGAIATLMAVDPVDYDFTPFLLILMVGHMTAAYGVRRGLAVLLAAEVVVLGLWLLASLPGAAMAIWAVALVLGLDLGFILRSQQLRIEAQARDHEVRERQAVLEERARIGREVHDLVAHSLSVTMLHLTAARREVEDAAHEGAPDPEQLDDAIAALRDAERVGRRAMADIRGTVGLLGQEQAAAATAPTPGLEDVPALLADYRGAGLDVGYDTHGDLAQVPASTALGLYRIVQESLANVAKHAPGSRVTVRLDVDRDPGELVVASDLPGSFRRNPGGSGLSGMAERAAQLGARFSAGPDDTSWVVRVELLAATGAA